eukprot:CAMPEP_0178961198 /NCGR_PEP_ID=MMETSP0789-20121207/13536_1 /TAXON_ID=3005 /ORGANISM="Rhizosolenia setigera, Strain CCMP 1694" /LENGTH=715 /DNA_ID=CAMNT_0020644931 /DNA_START=396 /DNA_END=2543 /DNA_ORIENTATION=+
MATDSRSLQRQYSFLKQGYDGLNGLITNGATLTVERQHQTIFQSSKQQQNAKSNGANTANANGGDKDRSIKIKTSADEEELFDLLRQVTEESCRDEKTGTTTTLRVAGGWVRDKILATDEFQKATSGVSTGLRLTSKWAASKGRKGTSIISSSSTSTNSLFNKNVFQPLDIDIALDDMLGREFADKLNEWLLEHGRDRISVGVVMKNPEKSKHLETATMKVGQFWIDFVNLRAEEYAGDSRIPDLMRIGTAEEDAFRRDLTINALFYNINKGCIEDLTGRGIEDLRKGVVATPLHPLTTLLDDPLRILRSIRFAARLRFTMDEGLRNAAKDKKVREALAMKVSRERIGGEVDLMLRSPDPVGAVRLLVNLQLAGTVFPLGEKLLPQEDLIYSRGLKLLTTTHDYLCDCKVSPPSWCEISKSSKSVTFDNECEVMLKDDEEARRMLWYSAFLKPLHDYYRAAARLSGDEVQHVRKRGKKANRGIIMKVMLDELKRPARDAENVEKIIKAADEFTRLINDGVAMDPRTVLLTGISVRYDSPDYDDNDTENRVINCSMQEFDGEVMHEIKIDSVTVENPIWKYAMQYRLECAQILDKVQSLWRAALILSLSEQLAGLDFDHAIEEDVIGQSQEEIRRGIIAQYDAFAASLLQLGLVGIWKQKPLTNGEEMKKNVLKNIPKGPVFRDIMDEQVRWMILHPGGEKEHLNEHLKECFPEYV